MNSAQSLSSRLGVQGVPSSRRQTRAMSLLKSLAKLFCALGGFW